MALIHGTCIELDGTGVLLRGPPGSGKSDLALRLIDGGGRLVADDQVVVEEAEGTLMASAPEAIGGFLEVRGLGLVRMPTVASAKVGLVVELVSANLVKRLPEPATCTVLSTSLPLVRLEAFAASACAKVRLAACAVHQDIMASS